MKTSIVVLIITIVIAACTKGGKLEGVQGNLYAVTSSASSEQLLPAIDTTAAATFTGLYDETANIFTCSIAWTDLWRDSKKDTITSINFYAPATASSNGPLVRTLSLVNTNRNGTVNIGLSGNTGLTGDEKGDLLAGAWYFTINTKRYAAGIVRGQLSITQQ